MNNMLENAVTEALKLREEVKWLKLLVSNKGLELVNHILEQNEQIRKEQQVNGLLVTKIKELENSTKHP